MQIVNLSVTATAFVVSAAAQAAIYVPADWTSDAFGNGSASVTSAAPGSISLNYDFDGNEAMWNYPDEYSGYVTARFVNIATEDGPVTFNWAFDGNHSWYLATAMMNIFVTHGSATNNFSAYDGNVSGQFSFTGSYTVDLKAGDQWGITVGGSNFDSSLFLHGVVTLTGTPVPAPGALALVGAAGLIGGRRRKA